MRLHRASAPTKDLREHKFSGRGSVETAHTRFERSQSATTAAAHDSPAYFRAIGPMYGISQRDPENALIIAITMMTRKARWTSA